MPVLARGLCRSHYTKLLATLPGPKCAASEGCARRAASAGFCDKHYKRAALHGDDSTVLRRGPKLGSRQGPRKCRSTNPSYKAVHKWLAHDRGPAKTYPCAHCGSPAADWAYDYSDLNPLFDPRCNSPYSTDVNRYTPLCKLCHRQYDVQHAYGHVAGGGGVWRIFVA